MKFFVSILLALLAGCSSLPYQKETASPSEIEAANSAAPDIPYQVVENLVGGAANPALIMYLHSNSGSGTDGKKQMSQVSAQNIEKYIKGNNIPAYFLKEKNIDKSRIYICGTSMGAMGVWRMLRDYPGFFTAAIVSSGQAQFATPSLYTYLPLYVTAGTEERSYEALKSFSQQIKEAGGTVLFDELEGMTHGHACDNSCSEERLKWLFSQKK